MHGRIQEYWTLNAGCQSLEILNVGCNFGTECKWAGGASSKVNIYKQLKCRAEPKAKLSTSDSPNSLTNSHPLRYPPLSTMPPLVQNSSTHHQHTSVGRCYCLICDQGKDDEWLTTYTPEQAVDDALVEYASAVKYLVKAEMQLEQAHKVFRQSNFRVLRLSRHLKRQRNTQELAKLRGHIAHVGSSLFIGTCLRMRPSHQADLW